MRTGTDVEITEGSVIGISPSGAPESAIDATGQDAYATIITPSRACSHILISNEGANSVTISLDAGTTDNIIKVAAASIVALDGASITAAVAIQAKNQSAGNNYTDLTITIW